MGIVAARSTSAESMGGYMFPGTSRQPPKARKYQAHKAFKAW
jgi:hypothetical protein